MKKYNNSTKILLGEFVLAIATCPLVFACDEGYTEYNKKCVLSGTDCNGNCMWYYDEDTNNLDILGSGIISNRYSQILPRGATINDVTIGEGIKGIKTVRAIEDNGKGKLTLPKSMESLPYAVIFNTSFKTIEIKSTKLNIGEAGLSDTKLENLIFTPGKDITIAASAFNSFGSYSNKINIYCKGIISECENQLGIALSPIKTTNFYHYEGLNDKGNWEKYSDDGMEIFYDSEKKILLAKYDVKGNLLSSYTYNPDGSISIYDANGKLTGLKNARSITPAQAAALVKKGNNNTVTLTFK